MGVNSYTIPSVTAVIHPMVKRFTQMEVHIALFVIHQEEERRWRIPHVTKEHLKAY